MSPAQIWVVDVDAQAAKLDSTSLSADELDRAQRLRNAHHGRRYAIAHAWLRTRLSSFVDVGPADLAFLRAPCQCGGGHGKPMLDGPGRDVHFSFSRSGAMAALAVDDAPIGIDIEMADPQRDVVALAERFFSPEETRHLAALEPARASSAFVQLWTRKEAFLKATGVGISGELDTPVLHDPEGGGGPVPVAGWWVTDLDLGPEMAGAVAATTCGAPEVVDTPTSLCPEAVAP